MLIKTVFGCGQMSQKTEGIKVSSSLEALVSLVWKKTESIPPPPSEEHGMDTPSPPRQTPKTPNLSICHHLHCHPDLYPLLPFLLWERLRAAVSFLEKLGI